MRGLSIHFGVSGDQPGGIQQVLMSYQRLSCPGWKIEVWTSGKGRGDVQSARLLIRCLFRLVSPRYYRKRSSIVFTSHLSHGGSFIREGLPLFLASALGYRTVAHIHGSNFVNFAARYPRLVGLVLCAADAVIVLNEKARETALRHGAAEKVHTIANAVIVEPLSGLSHKSKTVLFAGEVSYRKGADVLLSAWEQASLEGWQLLLAGPVIVPPESHYPESVRMLGSLPHKELREVQISAAICVLPSRGEGLPMALLEGMSFGCAAVGSDVGGIPVLLKDDVGVVVPAGDVAALRNALETLAKSEELRERMAILGYDRVRTSFSLDRLGGVLQDLWSSLLNSPAKRFRIRYPHRYRARSVGSAR